MEKKNQVIKWNAKSLKLKKSLLMLIFSILRSGTRKFSILVLWRKDNHVWDLNSIDEVMMLRSCATIESIVHAESL